MRFLKRFAGVVLAVLVLYVGVTFVQVWHASRQDDARPSGAIVVLGAAQYDGRPSPVLQARLDHAAELFEQQVAPTIVLTGGRRGEDPHTEASAGERYLLARGIPEANMLLESQGENSWQSLAATARILRDRGITEVILVTNAYHAFRVVQIADEVGLDGVASPSDRSPSLYQLARETAIVSVSRVIGYGRLVRVDERVDRVRERDGTG